METRATGARLARSEAPERQAPAAPRSEGRRPAPAPIPRRASFLRVAGRARPRHRDSQELDGAREAHDHGALPTRQAAALRFAGRRTTGYRQRAHNPKVAGSNPARYREKALDLQGFHRSKGWRGSSLCPDILSRRSELAEQIVLAAHAGRRLAAAADGARRRSDRIRTVSHGARRRGVFQMRHSSERDGPIP